MTEQNNQIADAPALQTTEKDNIIVEDPSGIISPVTGPVPVPPTAESLPSTVQQIAETLAVLFQPGQVVELRALFEDATASGYYDDMAKLAADADVVEAAQPQGIYVTLNEPSPALLSRRANRIKMRLGKKDATTADVDIIRRRWFPVDIDAVRPSGVSSTDAEHEAALAKAGRIAAYLREEGWPEPVIGDSGNGAHLLYRIDLPNTPESTDLVKKGLEALAFLFDDEQSRIDTANHNASRIWKLYGTVSRKGDSTRDRPHRRSRMSGIPDNFEIVSKDLFLQLSDTMPGAPPETKGYKSILKLSDWLTSYGIGIISEKPYQGGILYNLAYCPFSDGHRDGAFAIQFPNGAIHAGCHHNSCGGGSQRWPELRELFEPKTARKSNIPNRPPPGSPPVPSEYTVHESEVPYPASAGDRFVSQFPDGDQGPYPSSTGNRSQSPGGRGSSLPDRDRSPSICQTKGQGSPPVPGSTLAHDRSRSLPTIRDPHPSSQAKSANRSPCQAPAHPLTNALKDIPHYEEAMAVLEHGDPLRAMLNTFSLDHVGDEVPAECLIVSLASRSVENTNGLHVSISGESGKGKTDAFKTILKQVPERFRLEGAMSNKFLFYMDDLKPGTAIVFDDKSLSDEMQEILKGATSSFRKPIKYRTVSKDRKPQVCIVPERCIWWVAKVEGTGDDQVFNRMLTCWIDDSPEQDTAVLEDMAKKEVRVPGSLDETRPEVLTCQAMWEIIGRERVHVVIPYADRIMFQTKTNRRNPEMFYSLVKAHAMLFFMQRERCTIESGGTYTVATLDDFHAASRLFTLLNGSGGGQETKLTRCESELLTAVNLSRDCEFTIQQMQEKLNRTYNAIYSTLHGNRSRGQTYSGLLDKCPAISFIDRTVVMDEEIGRSVRRRTHAYQFNHEIYLLWSSGGQVWLRGNDRDDRPGPSGTTEHNGRITETSRVKNSHEPATETGILTCTNKKYNNSTTNNGNHRHRASQTGACAAPPSSSCEIEISGSEISDPSCCHPIPGPAPESPGNTVDTGPPEPPDVSLYPGERLQSARKTGVPWTLPPLRPERGALHRKGDRRTKSPGKPECSPDMQILLPGRRPERTGTGPAPAGNYFRGTDAADDETDRQVFALSPRRGEVDRSGVPGQAL